MVAIANGKIVMPDTILDGAVLLIENDRIAGLSDRCPEGAEVIDARGRLVSPGFIDVHSDRVEQFILPRPTSMLDFELALKECELELMLLGITTMYHSLALYKDEFFGKSPIRTRESVLKMAGLVRDIHSRSHLIRHRFHLRIEIDNFEAFFIAKDLIEAGMVHEISFNDHTPGQGQYRSLETYEKTITMYGGKEISTGSFESILEYHRSKKTLSLEQMAELSRLARERGVAVASHDDDTFEKLDLNCKIGVDISEFPISLETARHAKSRGLFVVVGAPNILLGGSHSGNMPAWQAILDGCADIICSDYYPPSILHAIFLMHEKYGSPLPEMFKMATLNPARAMKIDRDYGSLEPGKKADVLIIDVLDGYPVLTRVLIDGKTTARVDYRV